MPHFYALIYLHCRKIHNLFVRALETGRKVHERKLSSLMKKNEGKLQIRHNPLIGKLHNAISLRNQEYYGHRFIAQVL
jgi:hypothetical protein